MAFTELQRKLVLDMAHMMERGRVDKVISYVDELDNDKRLVYQTMSRLYERQMLSTFKISSLPMYDPVISYMLLMELAMRNYNLQQLGDKNRMLRRSTDGYRPYVLDVLTEEDKAYAVAEHYTNAPDRVLLGCGVCVVFTVPEHAVVTAANTVVNKHIIPSMGSFQELSKHSGVIGGDASAGQLLSTLLDAIVRNSDEYKNLQEFLNNHVMQFSQNYSCAGTRFSLADNGVAPNTTHGITERSFFVMIPLELNSYYKLDAINWLSWLGRISNAIIKHQMRGVTATLCCYQGKNNELILPQDVWLQRISEPLSYYGDPEITTNDGVDNFMDGIECSITVNGAVTTRKYPVLHYSGVAVITVDRTSLNGKPDANAPVYEVKDDSGTYAMALFTPELADDKKITIMLCYDANQHDPDDVVDKAVAIMCRDNTRTVRYSEKEEDDYPYQNQLLMNVQSGLLEWVPRGAIPEGYTTYRAPQPSTRLVQDIYFLNTSEEARRGNQLLMNDKSGRLEWVPRGAIPEGYSKVYPSTKRIY